VELTEKRKRDMRQHRQCHTLACTRMSSFKILSVARW